MKWGTAQEILRIPADEPERLFSNLFHNQTEYKALAKIWHPDINKDPEAGAVFAHIGALYAASQRKVEDGEWISPSELTVYARAGAAAAIDTPYGGRSDFELGKMYVAEHGVYYSIGPDSLDLLKRWASLYPFKMATHKMKEEVSRYLPGNQLNPIEGKKHIWVPLTKKPDMVRLRDLMAYMGEIPAVHIAWIMSRLHNFCCYLHYAGIVHHDLSPDTVFVSPQDHGAWVGGGWWYSSFAGQKMHAVPARTAALMPHDIRVKKLADPRVDLELVRAIGRELIGDAPGSKVHADVPKAMAQWFRLGGGGDAIKDYEGWQKVLDSSFGVRRFVELPVSFNAVYAQEI